jgi:hypothetical protein
MSEVDIRRICTEAQAERVISLLPEDWKVVSITNCEVMLRRDGQVYMVKADGKGYVA